MGFPFFFHSIFWIFPCKLSKIENGCRLLIYLSFISRFNYEVRSSNIAICSVWLDVCERLIEEGKKPGFFQLLDTQIISAIWHVCDLYSIHTYLLISLFSSTKEKLLCMRQFCYVHNLYCLNRFFIWWHITSFFLKLF